MCRASQDGENRRGRKATKEAEGSRKRPTGGVRGRQRPGGRNPHPPYQDSKAKIGENTKSTQQAKSGLPLAAKIRRQEGKKSTEQQGTEELIPLTTRRNSGSRNKETSEAQTRQAPTISQREQVIASTSKEPERTREPDSRPRSQRFRTTGATKPAAGSSDNPPLPAVEGLADIHPKKNRSETHTNRTPEHWRIRLTTRKKKKKLQQLESKEQGQRAGGRREQTPGVRHLQRRPSLDGKRRQQNTATTPEGD